GTANATADGSEARCDHAERANPEADERESRRGVAAHLAADGQLDARPLRRFHRQPDESKQGWMEWIAISLEGGIAPIDRERVLEQVVRAEARERDLARPAVCG